MAQSAKKKDQFSEEEFILMGRTRALLSEAWSLWAQDLKNSPAIVKRMLEEGVKELHRTEMQVLAKSRQVARKQAAEVDKKVAKKILPAIKKATKTVEKVAKLKRK